MKSFWKYLITVLVGLACVAGIIWTKGIAEQTQLVNILHILCDGFFVVGVVMTGAGLLIFTSNEGAFDMMVYGVKSFIDLFRKTNTKKYDTYYDYTVSRQSKKQKFGFLLICGICFLAVSAALFYFYRQYS